ncbi:sugar-binding protein [Pseudomonas lundensis]|uniref:RHS repeat domain-containing protein n=1 Tax=Pseudomonas lundensis TaxID=86185 RepID=UPI000BA290EA|nr:sugar-binding protein [Pseudomonas lundensis]NNA07069.1 sugar-binding protein [Pseudomonas lundensis]OZY50750.1 hypothetical protein CJF34_10885 [Pseudomonas lundensis]
MAASTAVHSNAFNFLSYLQGGVDPRTGQYTVAISMPAFKANNLAGPELTLQLGFNPLNAHDMGCGLGWSLQRTEYDPVRSIISLSSGETFKVNGVLPGMEGLCEIEEQKILSFKLYDKGNGRYLVAHKSGQLEELEEVGRAGSKIALPVRLHSFEGRTVSLYYEDTDFPLLLTRIEDEQAQTIFISTRDSDNNVMMHLHPYAGEQGTPLATFELLLDGDNTVKSIVLPTPERANWRFKYQQDPVTGLMFIVQAHTPVGGQEDITYDWSGHPLPPGAFSATLPRVTHWQRDPGFGQGIIETQYSYSETNFLGAGSGITWDNSGVDNLYQASMDYVYQSLESWQVAGQAVKTIERLFNSFHLLTSELTTQGANVLTVSTEYYLQVDVPFSQQWPYCQLPKNTITQWSSNTESLLRSQTEYREYDMQGNETLFEQANGVIEESTYYPWEGEGQACPPDPKGFIRHLKNTTIRPNPAAVHAAPILSTTYTYKLLPSFNNVLDHWHVQDVALLESIDNQVLQVLQSTQYEYNDDVNDPLRHGLLARETLNINGHVMSTEYDYDLVALVEQDSGFGTLRTKIVNSSDVDSHTKTVLSEASIYSGLPLLVRDDNDVEIRYEYDALQRVTREIVAPGTKYEAARSYHYMLCSQPGDQAIQSTKNVKDVLTVTFFDGFNRTIAEQRMNADSKLKAKLLRPTYAAQYDALGQLEEETEYDWEGEKDWPLVTHLRYDDWGQQVCSVGPDSVETYEVMEPRGANDWQQGGIKTAWQQSVDNNGNVTNTTGKTVTYIDRFDNPVRLVRFNKVGDYYSTHSYEYDGLGRKSKEVDALSNTTLYSYDAYDRTTHTTLPGGAIVRRDYALHTVEDLPISISVDGTLLGTQAFDGLGRMSASSIGKREQSYEYAPGQTQPNKVIKSRERSIDYKYNPLLGEEPELRTVNGVEAIYEYDPANARMRSCAESGVTIVRDYFSTGELSCEEMGEYSMAYRYSLRGLILAYTDVLGNTQDYEYDFEKGGRVCSTRLGKIASCFTYDELGQTQRITTTDTTDELNERYVVIDLHYDEFGREVQRVFDLNGSKQKLSQTYTAVDNLERRVLIALDEEGADGEILRDESYEYDARARLTKYTCEGSQKPVDPRGNAIDEQLFRFDALDNITRVKTSFASEFNMASYYYENLDPVQLSKIVNTHGSYPSQIDLEYDDDGNMTRDECGRVLDYDDLGRLINVSETVIH